MNKITVIVSAHKESPYLIEALKSAINQDFNDYDVILSSDGCLELEALADRFGVEFCFSPKKNHSAALNNAVYQSTGEWIKDCHYDDILLPNCLADLWEGRGGSVVHANAINFFEDGRETIYRAPEKIGWNDLWPPFRNPVHAATLMWRRDDFITIGGRDEDMVDAEDYEYYLRLLSLGYEIHHCDKTVVKYRRHEDQKTETYTSWGPKRMAVLTHLLKKYDKRNSSSAYLE